MTDRRPDHDWVLQRLVSYATGLLAIEEQEPLESHLEECPSCRQALEVLRPADEPGGDIGEHVPAALIANWERARGELRGLTRELVRRHLARCRVCREDLVTLGHRPELERVPTLEPSADVLALLTARAPESDAPEPVPAEEAGSRQIVFRVIKSDSRPWWQSWGAWALGSWALAASVAAVLVVMNPGLVGIGPAGGVGPSAASRLVSGLGPAGAATDLSSEARGNGSSAGQPVPALLAPGQDAVRLTVEPQNGIPPDVPLDVTIERESGEVLARAQILHRDLVNTGRGILWTGASHFEPGIYVLRVRANGSSEGTSYRFELRAKPT